MVLSIAPELTMHLPVQGDYFEGCAALDTALTGLLLAGDTVRLDWARGTGTEGREEHRIGVSVRWFLSRLFLKKAHAEIGREDRGGDEVT